jgi:hypothetical protein
MAYEYELAPATRMLWRETDVVQFELGDRAVVVDGLTAAGARTLTSHRQPDDVQPDGAAVPALRQLAELGMVWPRGAERAADRLPPAPRLAGELAALSARVGPSAATLLALRRAATVAVHGTGRAGPHIGAVLASAGVGNVHFLATSDVRLQHAQPGGVTPADETQRLARAAREAVLRAAPGTSVQPPRDAAVDLVVLAVDEPVDDDRRDALHRRGLAHLCVALGPAGAVVGPLVLPGLTSCLRCADLHRADRDGAWPRLAVQLSVGRRYGPASEVAVATIAAGVAAMQALAFLDGAEPTCLDGTLELHPPDWRLRRRSWPVHPDCDCCVPP